VSQRYSWQQVTLQFERLLQPVAAEW
jgi:hypothetical protein